jgi:hypothetical protein
MAIEREVERIVLERGGQVGERNALLAPSRDPLTTKVDEGEHFS